MKNLFLLYGVLVAGGVWWSGEPTLEGDRALEAADAAFERGDYASALGNYEFAEGRATDPGRLAFNKAATLYHLGRYAEAEHEYIHAEEDALGARLARLHFNLGNTLVKSAGDNVRLLERAVGCYESCIRAPSDTGCEEDARHNLAIAQALLRQARTRRARHPPQSERSDDNTRMVDGAARITRTSRRDGEAGQRSDSSGQDFPAEKGDSLMTPTPGMGNIPVQADRGRPPLMSAEEARRRLDEMATRIEHERRERRSRSAWPHPADMRDW